MNDENIIKSSESLKPSSPVMSDKDFKKWTLGITKKFKEEERAEKEKKKFEQLYKFSGGYNSSPTPILQSKLIEETKIFDDYRFKIVFPKIADELIDDIGTFSQNVANSVHLFRKLLLPRTRDVEDMVISISENDLVCISEYKEKYPTVWINPKIIATRESILGWLKNFQTSEMEMYWRGSFLKNVTDGKIHGIKLSNIAYNKIDKTIGGRPITFEEKLLF